MTTLKEYSVVGSARWKGRLFDIQCPFCFHVFEVSLESFNSIGKKCPKCRAHHKASGMAEQPKILRGD